MTIIKHELKQGLKGFFVWTAVIAFLLVICIFMFPEMKGEMDGVSDMFASMGSFTAAFGMDKVNFGTFIGFYTVECGNMLGLGGSAFAALIAVSVLAKEEKERTAEFLLTHPVSRARIITEKLLAVVIEIIAMNIIVWGLSVASVAMIGEDIPFKEINLLHVSNLLLQLEIAGVCLGISAFLKRGSVGIGIGIAAIMYFLNIIANISDKADFLNYITPFTYTEGADIVTNGSLDAKFILVGYCYAVVGVVAAYLRYTKKDIA